jgi:hypothetical protein
MTEQSTSLETTPVPAPAPMSSSAGISAQSTSPGRGKPSHCAPRLICGFDPWYILGVYLGCLAVITPIAMAFETPLTSALLGAFLTACCYFLCIKSEDFLDIRWWAFVLVAIVVSVIQSASPNAIKTPIVFGGVIFWMLCNLFGYLGKTVGKAIHNARHSHRRMQ